MSDVTHRETVERLTRERDAARAALERLSYVFRHCVGRGDCDVEDDADVLQLCLKYGFGAVMDSASRQWARRDSVAALTVGPCLALVEDALDAANAALRKP